MSRARLPSLARLPGAARIGAGSYSCDRPATEVADRLAALRYSKFGEWQERRGIKLDEYAGELAKAAEAAADAWEVKQLGAGAGIAIFREVVTSLVGVVAATCPLGAWPNLGERGFQHYSLPPELRKNKPASKLDGPLAEGGQAWPGYDGLLAVLFRIATAFAPFKAVAVQRRVGLYPALPPSAAQLRAREQIANGELAFAGLNDVGMWGYLVFRAVKTAALYTPSRRGADPFDGSLANPKNIAPYLELPPQTNDELAIHCAALDALERGENPITQLFRDLGVSHETV